MCKKGGGVGNILDWHKEGQYNHSIMLPEDAA